MVSYLRHTARVACAISLLACASENSPTAPVVDSSEVASLDAVAYSTGGPTPEELAGMPPEFSKPPTILSTRTDVGFNADGAWAQAVMDYFATSASQEVTLVVRAGDREVARKTARGAEDYFLPAFRTLHTMVAIPLSGSCGHVADGQTAHKAWHKFLVSGWKLLMWGEYEEPSNGMAEQGSCAPPPPARDGGGGEDPYEGGCELCQQWFYYIDGRMVSEWWECTEVDLSYCGVGDTR